MNKLITNNKREASETRVCFADLDEKDKVESANAHIIKHHSDVDGRKIFNR